MNLKSGRDTVQSRLGPSTGNYQVDRSEPVREERRKDPERIRKPRCYKQKEVPRCDCLLCIVGSAIYEADNQGEAAVEGNRSLTGQVVDENPGDLARLKVGKGPGRLMKNE